jgi:hypothetical protein
MASRGSFGAGPQGPAGLSTGPASGDLGGTYPSPTLQPTASVASIIRANTLDQLAPAAANVNLNTHKIIGLVNGTVSTDAVAFGQIPTTLPPSGSATGDLAGTYPAPTLNTTSNVSTIIRANRLDQMAAPSASVNMNNQKLTNVSNATVTSDAVNLGQVPTSLPPNGAASGDLSSSYPAPTVAKINGISASGTPAYGQVLAANTSSAATWQILPGFMASTGVTSGGAMTQNGSDSTAFDIVQTVGYITDYVTTPANPTITKVTIPAQTVVISGLNATRTVNWWVADSTGTISSIGSNHLTETQRRNMIQLGATASVPGTGQILTIAPAPTQLIQPYNQLQDLMLSLGPFSISGNIISFNGANLAFNKTAGTAFFPNFKASTEPNDPHTVDDPASAPSSFR